MAHHEHAHQLIGRQVRQVAEGSDGTTTQYSVVFVTASPTFSGSTAGFSTASAQSNKDSANSSGPNFFDAGSSDSPAAPTTVPQQAAASATAQSQAGSSIAIGAPLMNTPVTGGWSAPAATAAAASASAMTWHLNNGPPAGATATVPTTLLPSVIPATSAGSGSVSSAIVSDTSSSDSSSSSASLLNAASTNSASASASPSAAASSGAMSSGAKAGLAFGIIILIAMIAGAAFVFYRKRKERNDAHQPLEDEKSAFHSAPAPMSSAAPAAPAPRLSLRPVTDMFPEMAQNKSRGPSPGPGSNPFDDANALNEKSGAAAAGVAAVAAKRQSPPPGSAMNVHRVQMDFAPSMEDELELKAGQLVRLLHEYDDGWALCKRLDGTQQGVTPRTCLSRLPVKPRPAGPPGGPNGPNMRGPPRPQGAPMNGRPPMGPNGAPRPMPGAAMPAPLSPNRSRTNSTSNAAKRMTPPSSGSSPEGSQPSSPNGGPMPSRKPVPGQAL